MRKNFQLAVACAVVLVMAQQSSAAPIIIDQSNAVGGDGLAYIGGDSVGQSFQPALTSIDAAEFSLTNTNDEATDLQVLVYSGVGYGGSLLGTSNTLTITGFPPTTYHFDFPSTIALTPGSDYTLRVQYVSGSGFAYADLSAADPYPNGDLLDFEGTPIPGADLVFAEGPHAEAVPEPSTLALLGVAAVIGVIACGRRHFGR